MKKGPNKQKAWRTLGKGRKGKFMESNMPAYPSYKIQELFVRAIQAGTIFEAPKTKRQLARDAAMAVQAAAAAPAQEQTLEVTE
jgi:hypothetical protein